MKDVTVQPLYNKQKKLEMVQILKKVFSSVIQNNLYTQKTTTQTSTPSQITMWISNLLQFYISSPLGQSRNICLYFSCQSNGKF